MTSIKAILFVVLGLFSAAIASPVDLVRRQGSLSGFSLCNSSPSILALSSLTYAPAPPAAGQPLTITVGGITNANITSARINVKATWIFGVTVLNENIDLCAQEGVSCPIPAGQNTISFSVAIPSTKPSIKVSVTADVKSAEGQSIVCVKNANFQL
ncbi:Phosphatidylglycerol/phosphatidylinositol transfer protein [Dinochytrium kinnereticum]|nr:Phosphatidylglycerol/phosphatidylinositol transfer protein [Dinochytrium kinnereticum]